jgi:hypothetical protein
VAVVSYSIANQQALSRFSGQLGYAIGLGIILVFGVGGVLGFVNLQNQAALLQTILDIEINTEDTAEAVLELSRSIDRLVVLLQQRSNNPQVSSSQQAIPREPS